MKIRIRGEGIGAYCCALLLSRAGLHVRLERTNRLGVPAILLSDYALAFIRDIFGRPDLFADQPHIERRVVAWGPGAEPVVLPHSAVVVSEEQLLNSLRMEPLPDESAGDADFEVLASRPLPGGVEEHRFGSRAASAVTVRLRNPGSKLTCWVESFDDGWLFLIPAGETNWLMAVGGSPEKLLESSRLIAPEVELLGRRSAAFATCPRIVSPLSGTNWLTCGSAAMAFDPICGDGTATAVREAILASAAIRVIASGGDAGAAMAHYGARLTAGFERHLRLCCQYYSTGGAGAWWRGELDALKEGIAWCEAKARTHGAFRYRLQDFDLIPLSA